MNQKMWVIPAILAAGILGAAIFALLPVGITKAATSTSPNFFIQSDHGLISFATGDTAGFCGSKTAISGTGANATMLPWILNVAASGGASGGTLRLTFNDGDSVDYPIAAGTSFSAQFSFGGVIGVDNVVKISRTGFVNASIVPQVVISALATGAAVDPFTGDSSINNFCVVSPGETPGGNIGTFPTGAPTYSVS